MLPSEIGESRNNIWSDNPGDCNPVFYQKEDPIHPNRDTRYTHSFADTSLHNIYQMQVFSFGTSIKMYFCSPCLQCCPFPKPDWLMEIGAKQRVKETKNRSLNQLCCWSILIWFAFIAFWSSGWTVKDMSATPSET